VLQRELIRVATISPILLAIVLERKRVSLSGLVGATPRRMALLQRQLEIYVIARLVAVALQLVSTLLLHFRPAFDWLSLLVRGSFGWPLTTLLFVGLSELWSALAMDDPHWAALERMARYEPLLYWLSAVAVTYPFVEAGVQFYINDLTLRHYENRAQEAFQAQRLLRRIVAAARAVLEQKKREQRRAETCARTHSSTAPWASKTIGTCMGGSLSCGVSRDVSARSDLSGAAAEEEDERRQPEFNPDDRSNVQVRGRWDKFFVMLEDLSGPLEFGANFDDAASVDQARRRANKVFTILEKQRELLNDSGDANAAVVLSRDKLIAWAIPSDERDRFAIGARALFRKSETFDRDAFISAVERCYKEQRLLTASVASFDRINLLLHRTCICVWAFMLGFVFIIVWGVDVNLVVIPYISVIGSVIVLMGRAPGDIISGALYILLFRPYDIGDRVTISHPGEKADLWSLVVKQIDVVRTHFLTSHGELLLIENHLLRNMSMVNLSRSGPTTMMIRVQTPVVTPKERMTELVDCINQYVSEKEPDWIEVDCLFSSTDLSEGHLNLDVWATCRHPAADIMKVFNAKSQLVLFLHAYMQSANIEYVRPLQPFISKTSEMLNFAERESNNRSAAPASS